MYVYDQVHIIIISAPILSSFLSRLKCRNFLLIHFIHGLNFHLAKYKYGSHSEPQQPMFFRDDIAGLIISSPSGMLLYH